MRNRLMIYALLVPIIIFAVCLVGLTGLLILGSALISAVTVTLIVFLIWGILFYSTIFTKTLKPTPWIIPFVLAVFFAHLNWGTLGFLYVVLVLGIRISEGPISIISGILGLSIMAIVIYAPAISALSYFFQNRSLARFSILNTILFIVGFILSTITTIWLAYFTYVILVGLFSTVFTPS